MVPPKAFEDLISATQGAELWSRLEAGYQGAPRSSLRLNPSKSTQLTYPANPVAWCPDGRVLDQRPFFAQDPLWHAGAYYVQEAGSMAVGEAVRALAPADSTLALDLCAAPGGKSTHLRAILPKDCLLICNEVIRSRIARLQENLHRWGHPGVVITSLDPQFFGTRTPNLFDILVIDAPCSGEGLFRKDPNAAEAWSQDLVALCAQRQKRILADSWPALKPGGLLVYSTCTFNTSEDEDVLSFCVRELGAELLAMPDTISNHGLPSTLFPQAVRFLPNDSGTEGQFLAVLRKHGGWCPTAFDTYSKKEASKLQAPSSLATHLAQQALPAASTSDFFSHSDEIRFLPNAYWPPLLQLLQHIPIVSAGIGVGSLIANKLQPVQSLAWLAGQSTAFPNAELSLSVARQFLKKEDLRDQLNLLPGIYRATFQGLGLGWLKAIVGGRINNLLPSQLRIRADLQPDEAENGGNVVS